MRPEIWFCSKEDEHWQLLASIGEGVNLPFTPRRVAAQMIEGLKGESKLADYRFEVRENGEPIRD